MGHYRSRKAAQQVLTGLVMVTVLATTFLPDWVTRAHAAPAPADPAAAMTIDAPGIAPDAATAAAIDMAPGAEIPAVWSPPAADSTLDLSAIPAEPDIATSLTVVPTDPTLDGGRAAYAVSNQDTSTFLAGDVAVEVVFVESTGATENWTAEEISKVKNEVSSALNWWSVAATAPYDFGGTPRPSANLTWSVTYRSPLEGTTAERDKVKVSVEPIQGGILTGAPAAVSSWIPTLATNFTGMPPGEAASRAWADQARDNAGTDWGFVLFVVDSSNDPDGKFNADQKAAGAALNGPWAVVTYDGGDLGVSNLEIIIAKMVAHVFGAGDESYNSVQDTGCQNDEVYGYLRIMHANCERDNFSPDVSLMRSGATMIGAYRDYLLSEEARGQLGWRDSDGDGVYDVMDTLEDSFNGLGSQPVCSIIHLTDIDVHNDPPMPNEYGSGDETQWYAEIWDPALGMNVESITYHPVNINRVGFVWGRINNSGWIPAEPADGIAWDEEDEGYNIQLPGNPGASNQVEIAIMNRWDQQSYLSPSPVSVTVKAAPTSGLYQSSDTNYVDLFPGLGVVGGWSTDSQPGYSGGSTVTTALTGNEACFSFDASEVTLLHSKAPTFGTANVYLDGELHSTINYNGTAANQVEHVIGNLPSGKHTVQLVATGGVIDFDAFEITDTLASEIISGLSAIDFPPGSNGFYEHNAPKIRYVGAWTAGVTINNADRVGGPGDNRANRSSTPYDRFYATIRDADTIAVYRAVFPGGGSADVYLNGEKWGTMQNHAYATRITPYYISGLTPTTTYTLEVRINPGSPRFDLDALRVLNLNGTGGMYTVPIPGAGDPLPAPVQIPFNGAQEYYGDWTLSGGNFYARQQGAVANVYFKGSAIAVRRQTGDGRGMMELYVDGKLMRTVNDLTYASSNAPVIVHGLDPNFPHVLQVRLTHTNPAAALWTVIQGFTVYYVEPVGPGEYEEYEEYNASRQPIWSYFMYEGTWVPPYYYPGGPSEDFLVYSSHPLSRAYLYFTDADALTIYGVRGPFGVMDIYVNGEKRGSFNESGGIAFDKPYTVTGLDPNRQNVLELRPAGTSPISIDRVVLFRRPILEPVNLSTPRTYENDQMVPMPGATESPALQFSGSWTRVIQTASHNGGTVDTANSILDEVSFAVRNTTSVVVYRRLASTFGVAEVYVDGMYYTSFNNSSVYPQGLWQAPYVISGLEPGFSHVITIKPQVISGQMKPFDIDYIVVRGGESSGFSYLENNYYQNDNANALSGGAITYIGDYWSTVNTPANPAPGGGANNEARSQYLGERAMVVFKGNAFSVYFNRYTAGGYADVYVDGKLKGRVNTRSATTYDVPFTVAGLSNGIHTAEIIVLSAYVNIDAYEAHTMVAEDSPTYNLIGDSAPYNIDNRLLLSGNWFRSGDYLRTNEADAAIYLYVTGGDTLFMTRETLSGLGPIEVFANNDKVAVANSNYTSLLGTPTETYKISGLAEMTYGNVWLRIRNPGASYISLKELRIGELTPKLSAGCNVQAEGSQVHRAGYWTNLAYPLLSGGMGVQPYDMSSRMYIPVQGVNYVSIYRALGGFGSADVYIDGELWGTMGSQSAALQVSVPFPVGPIPNPSQPHVVELRPASATRYVLDRITCQSIDVLTPGYYEDNDAALANSYFGSWHQINEANASGGTLRQSTVGGDRLVTVFDGSVIKLYRRTSPYGRVMTAYVDGVKYPIQNYGPVGHRIAHSIVLPEGGTHTLELINEGAGWLDLDAIEIGTAIPAIFGAYQENDSKVFINSMNVLWSTVNSAQHSGGAYIQTDKQWASVFLPFYGQRVTTYFTEGRYWGMMSFYLDGEFVAEIDLLAYNPADTSQDVNHPFTSFDIPNLPKENHVLEVRFEGRRSYGLPKVNVDAFTVDGAPVPRPGENNAPAEPDPGDGGGGADLDVPTSGCFEEAHSNWVKTGGLWFPQSSTGASGDWYVKAPDNLAEEVSAEFAFAATGLSFMYHKNPTGGLADIYVDGVKVISNLSMYSPVDAWIEDATLNIPSAYGGAALDPNVEHVFKIVKRHQPGTGGGINIYIDRLDLPVYNANYNDNCFFSQ